MCVGDGGKEKKENETGTHQGSVLNSDYISYKNTY